MSKQLFFSLVMVLASLYTMAQSFEVAPIKLNFTANPGETQTKMISVKNHGNQKASLVLSLKDYLVYKDGDRKILSPGASKNSIAEWITLNPSYLELNPNQAQSVEVTLQAPNDDFTSKWGILNVTSAKEQTSLAADKELSAGLNLYGRISVELSYTPRNQTSTRVQISNLRELTQSADSLRKFNVNIDNLGNTMTKCEIYLIASHMKTLKEKKYEPVEITAYPQSTRNVELTLPAHKLKPGNYSLSAILDYGSSQALEGTQITIEVE